MKGEIELIYVILEYTSIVLFLFLLGHCIRKSINYTLQIFCIVAIFNNINESTLLFFHDHNHNHKNTDNQNNNNDNNISNNQNDYDDLGASVYGTRGCTISAFLEQFLPLMMTCLATCMAFNIWFLVIIKARFTERELVKWYAAIAVLVAGIPTCIAAVLLRNEPFFSAFPRRFYCNLEDGPVTRGTFAGTMLAVAIPGILLALHTVIYLVQHYVFFRKTLVLTLTPSSNVVIELR
ncbi:MAG: hypothetical protein J3R72DRAFT_516493 [Linnemannia gamsii]|nr:MAG: hypothetical protein J3R72DRAFT_516493 [Linnemannia gamsii]